VDLRRHASSWIPVLSLAAVIFALSAQPGSELSDLPFPHADKLAHTAVFGLLGLCLLRTLLRSLPDRPFRFHALVTIVACTLYGASDELHQLFVPHRTAELLDLLADALGAAFACLFVWLARRRPA
jgi:VanZ family protein